jgi:lipopolysaccharide transport system ATP-binding protein
MSAPAIAIRGLSKQYRLGERGPRYLTLRDALANAARRILRFSSASSRQDAQHIWALKDVSFDVQPGEVIGLIGRNGAGKSTLLKILAEITSPTEGEVEICGRVGSLLEVGTGFHPELTGRENIFLNGAILGMTRSEIRRKFDEIVAFAEVEKFIDTPVKWYSSGMHVRLAFAVAAHLEPEILLVDEVLAVGDAQFQKKCMGKMSEVARGRGRTILFVSHNMAAVEALCQRCVLLGNGRVAALGPTDAVIAEYLKSAEAGRTSRVDLRTHSGRRKRSRVILLEAETVSPEGAPVSSITPQTSIGIRAHFDAGEKTVRPVLGVAIKTFMGTPLFAVDNETVPGLQDAREVRKGVITCHLDRLPLAPGAYHVDLYFRDSREMVCSDVVYEALSFEVLPSDVFGSGKLPHATFGPLLWPARWTLEPAD